MPATGTASSAARLRASRSSKAAKSDSPETRTVRVKRGQQPSRAPLTPFQRWAWIRFKDRVTMGPAESVFEDNLLKAHMRLRAEEYLAMVMGVTLITAVALSVVGVILGVFIYLSGTGLTTLILAFLIAVMLPVGGTVVTNVLMKSTPASAAKRRGQEIDRRIGPAMSFVSAMASADVNIDRIFRDLAQEKVYGAVADEAAWITRDTELLGVDILTAIRTGAARTPSKRFQDFLQGVVTTATSGGQLKPYFLLKAEQYQRENKLDVLRRTETMGLLAETFVTVVVAFPLFLVIIIAIFAIIGSGGGGLLEILWGIIGAMIPMFQFAFILFMQGLAAEA
jgi:archaeal flagellar protein FlaJ